MLNNTRRSLVLLAYILAETICHDFVIGEWLSRSVTKMCIDCFGSLFRFTRYTVGHVQRFVLERNASDRVSITSDAALLRLSHVLSA